MKTSSIIAVLLNLGVHVGHRRTNYENSYLNTFLYIVKNKYSIIHLKKTIFFLKKALFFLKSVGLANGSLLFYYSDLYNYSDEIKLLFVNMIVEKGDQSFFDQQWSFGLISNFKVQANQILNQLFYVKKSNKINVLLDKENFNLSNIRWIDLLCRIIYFTNIKYISGISWNDHLKRIYKFWRFFIFFKFFRNFINFPDTIILSNPRKINSLYVESIGSKIPIISLVDSDYINRSINYIIPSNDDSILITLFFFKLFLNSYKLGKL